MAPSETHGQEMRYLAPPGVRSRRSGRQVTLTTSQGGFVWIDRIVLELWKAAQGRTLDEILQDFKPPGASPDQVRAGLACLAESGLLRRDGCSSPDLRRADHDGDRVSVILVGFNSLPWLDGCLEALAAQTCIPFEILFVDNGPQDGSAAWLAQNHPQVRQVKLDGCGSLARAINTGIQAARGDYYLLLNPDVKLHPVSLIQMLVIAQKHPLCAAVAPKLRLLFAPSFLNGLGNLVGRFSWGTDLGLGHLDLGQFDHWEELPSACFAAALIPAAAIQAVGPLDENFPLYYEDSEWCYRARLFGWNIQAAPQALADHAFGALPGQNAPMAPAKLQQVTHGRLRWITCINGTGHFWSFLLSYLVEDLLRLVLYLLAGKWLLARAILRGWDAYRRSLGEVLSRRRLIQARRRITYRQLFSLQREAPVPAMRGGYPQLTWDRICSEYLPLFHSGRTIRIPEIIHFSPVPPQRAWERIVRIGRIEGIGALIFWLARNLLWRLMQP